MFQVQRELAFSKRLREARLKAGLKQTQIADGMGLSRQHVNNWCKGYCKPKGARLRELAKTVKADPHWLEHGDQSEIHEEIEQAMQLMRVVVRKLNHINQALTR